MTTDYTPQVQALTEPGKTWGDFDSSVCFTFYYDAAHKRLYCYYNSKSEIKPALEERNFKGDNDWNIVYQDPQNPYIFYGNHSCWHFIVKLVGDSTIQQLVYNRQEGEKYYYHFGNNASKETFSTHSKVDL